MTTRRVLVISLDTDLGRKRRSNIGLSDMTLIPGVLPSEVPEFVREHWSPGRFAPERNARLRGAFSAHLRAWETLANEGSPEAIILEDDALFLRPIPTDLPDALTLLGGVFCGCRTWSKPDDFVKKGEFVDEFESFTPGVHELPVRNGMRMKWYMAVAYYIPAGMAEALLREVYTTEKKRLKSPDTWLNNFATHFVWPPPFGDQGAESQCLTTSEYHDSDFYCNTRMFRTARRLGLMDRLSRVIANATPETPALPVPTPIVRC
jgi:hypothetical protein